jgi:hypothetical protein
LEKLLSRDAGQYLGKSGDPKSGDSISGDRKIGDCEAVKKST